MGSEKLNDFGPATYQAWRDLLTKDLAGATFEKKLVKKVAGLDVAPLYIAENAPGVEADLAGLPGFSPYARGAYALGAVEMGWDLRPEVAQPEPQAAARAVMDDINGGATSFDFRFDRATRAASDDYGVRGIRAVDLGDLAAVLEPVPLEKLPVSFDAGATGIPLAAGLLAVARRRRIDPKQLTGTFGLDPLGTLAAHGALTTSAEQALADAARVALWAHEHTPRVRPILIRTSPFHEASADPATEIAVALGLGVSYLRALEAAGLPLEAGAAALAFEFSVGRDFFLEIAKLRAARLAWARLVEATGAPKTAGAMWVHARTSRRTKTQRDPWVNLLRGTAESFSAAVGGADAITTAGFDASIGPSDPFGQRLARNTQHVLQQEANLHRVVDPAGGSYYVEALTHGLARKAWDRFRAIEQAGGLVKALLAGDLQRELEAQLEGERAAVATRKVAITGVNEFAFVGEDKVERGVDGPSSMPRRANGHRGNPKGAPLRAPNGELDFAAVLEAIEAGAPFVSVRQALARGEGASCPPLVRERLAQPIETLRDDADQAFARTGKRPTAFLVNLGPIADHKARAGYAQNFLEAGGFKVIGNDGFSDPTTAAAAFEASLAPVAVLCASDAGYAALAVPVAAALVALGPAAPRALVLAGSPGDAEAKYREAGVTHFVFVGQNLVTSLRDLAGRAGAA